MKWPSVVKWWDGRPNVTGPRCDLALGLNRDHVSSHFLSRSSIACNQFDFHHNDFRMAPSPSLVEQFPGFMSMYSDWLLDFFFNYRKGWGVKSQVVFYARFLLNIEAFNMILISRTPKFEILLISGNTCQTPRSLVLSLLNLQHK